MKPRKLETRENGRRQTMERDVAAAATSSLCLWFPCRGPLAAAMVHDSTPSFQTGTLAGFICNIFRRDIARWGTLRVLRVAPRYTLTAANERSEEELGTMDFSPGSLHPKIGGSNPGRVFIIPSHHSF